MNNLFANGSVERRAIIRSNNGGVAIVRFSGKRRRGFIEEYRPSDAYVSHIRRLTCQRQELAKLHASVPYPEVQLPSNSPKNVMYIASCLMNAFIRYHSKYKTNAKCIQLRQAEELLSERGSC